MVSLVVLNYNDSQTTIDFLNHIKDFKIINHIIVVDNFSSDDSFSELSKYNSEKIDIIRTNKNLGYAGGNNLGINFAIDKYNSTYIFVANPDIEISEEVVDEIYQKATNIKNLGVISCKMDLKNLPSAWKLPTFWNCVFEQFIILKKIFGTKYYYKKSFFSNDVLDVDVVAGSFFLITKEAFKSVSGFDEGTFLYYEESILSYKLKEKGFKNYLLNNLEYRHLHSISIDKSIKDSKDKLKIAFNSRKLYCKKYLKAGFVKMLVLKLSFYIGLFDYLIAKKILKK